MGDRTGHMALKGFTSAVAASWMKKHFAYITTTYNITLCLLTLQIIDDFYLWSSAGLYSINLCEIVRCVLFAAIGCCLFIQPWG